MTDSRWEQLPDGSWRCHAHGQTWAFPSPTCSACPADPGIAPAERALAPITFPAGCETDDGAWLLLTNDAVALAEDVAAFRTVLRQLNAKPETKVVSRGRRKKAVVVLTAKLVSQMSSVASALVKLQDARTKTMRAIIETAQAYRRDQRTKQMLEAKLAARKNKRGGAKK